MTKVERDHWVRQVAGKLQCQLRLANRTSARQGWANSRDWWIMSCDLPADMARHQSEPGTDVSYELHVANDGTGQPEFKRVLWRDGEQFEVVTRAEYDAGCEIAEQHGDKVADNIIPDALVTWPVLWEAMEMRWYALNLLCRMSL